MSDIIDTIIISLKWVRVSSFESEYKCYKHNISLNNMITIEKLKEYEEFHGYYDGFYTQKVKHGKNLTSDEEWDLISNFIQDIYLIQNNLAAKTFVQDLNDKLEENCDNKGTIEYLKTIASKGW